MLKRTGAQIIIHLLERQGVRIVSGIPGGANLPLYDALSHSTQIRHVLARHEQGAGFIAHGMARVSGQPAVCFASSGPGATNVLTAVADAKLDSIPLICITGQVPTTMIGTDAFQEIDTYGVSVPITKYNFFVRSADELLEVIPAAIGASLAHPERTVVCFAGDGSLLMNIQELATAAEQDVNVKIVVLNNNSLGLVHQQQTLFYGKRLYASDYRVRVDFVKIAEGFGVEAHNLSTADDPLGLLGHVLAKKGPCLINVPIDVEEKVYPMVPPGAANKDMLGGEG